MTEPTNEATSCEQGLWPPAPSYEVQILESLRNMADDPRTFEAHGHSGRAFLLEVARLIEVHVLKAVPNE